MSKPEERRRWGYESGEGHAAGGGTSVGKGSESKQRCGVPESAPPDRGRGLMRHSQLPAPQGSGNIEATC